MGCVYIATNTINGKQYVGKTVHTMEFRKRGHESGLDRKSNYVFKRALKKYGVEAFTWKVVLESDDEIFLNKMEVYLIKNKRTKSPHGYNMTDGGEGTKGMAEESRKRISESMQGNTRFAGKVCSPEHRAKISKAHKGKPGRKKTPEEIVKIQETFRLRGSHVGFKPGHIVPEKTRRAVSKANLGRAFTEEHKANLKKNHTRPRLGKKRGEEERRKTSEALKRWYATHPGPSLGKKASEETKQKLRDAHTRRKLKCQQG